MLMTALAAVVCCFPLVAANPAAAVTSQSISWPQQGPYAYGAAAPVLNAKASSGLPVSYSVTSGSCWLFGLNLIYRSAGSCVINASQGGNASYSPAPAVHQTITANPYVARAGSVLTGAMTATNAANQTGLVSICPVGSFVVGIEPWLQPVTSWGAGAQAICGTVAGATPGGYAGVMGGYASSGPSTGLVCPVGELAVGVYGRTGSYVGIMGARCAVPGIAGVNGPSAGGAGGVASGPFDCPSGDALIGLKGSAASTTGSDTLESLQGICYPASPVAAATGQLTGSGLTDVVGAVSICPAGLWVTGIARLSNSAGFTDGVYAECGGTAQYTYGPYAFNAGRIGGAAPVAPFADAECTDPNFLHPVATGLSGNVGTWVDSIGLTCQAAGYTAHVDPVGDSGGSPQGPFSCPSGYAMIGLQGSYSTTAFSGQDALASLKGICEKYTTTLGSAAPKTARYRGSDHAGKVRFSMLIRHSSVLGKPIAYQYILYRLSFATGCSRKGVAVPGQVTVSGRVSAGKQQRFSLRTKRYRLTGRISGPLAKPKVTGTLRVLSGACGGEVLPFRAKLAA
jgi:hypothetical protein